MWAWGQYHSCQTITTIYLSETKGHVQIKTSLDLREHLELTWLGFRPLIRTKLLPLNYWISLYRFVLYRKLVQSTPDKSLELHANVKLLFDRIFYNLVWLVIKNWLIKSNCVYWIPMLIWNINYNYFLSTNGFPIICVCMIILTKVFR